MNVIVTMTSWKGRIAHAGFAIYRFLTTQTELPTEFYLWLAKAEFPNLLNDLPTDLNAIIKHFNIKLCWTDENEYCFKRWYVYPQHQNDLVISIDDDMFYDKKLIETIKSYYIQHQLPCVIHYLGCGGVIKIINGIEYTISNTQCDSSVANYFMGQCAFTPYAFPLNGWTPEMILLRKKICPKCDESWLHPWLIYNNTPIIFLHGLQSSEDINQQNIALRNEMHHAKRNIGGVSYKEADILKFKILHEVQYLQRAWKNVFPNYNFDLIKV